MSGRYFLCCVGERTSTKTSQTSTISVDGTPDIVQLATGISAHERKLIRENGDIMFNQMHIEDKGVAFLIMFFKAYPHHQRYFKAFRGLPPDELKSIPQTENHGRRVMNEMASIVLHLEEPNAIREQLADLVFKHGPRNVKPRQMKDMLNMFLVYTKQQLGSKFTHHHEAAWKKMIAHMLDVLEEATQQANGTASPVDNGSIPRTEHVSEQVSEYVSENVSTSRGLSRTASDSV